MLLESQFITQTGLCKIEGALVKYAVIQHLYRRVNSDAVDQKLVVPVHSRLMVALNAYHASLLKIRNGRGYRRKDGKTVITLEE